MASEEGFFESLIQGATFGLSDVVGVTGQGGVIHDADDDEENQAILVDGDGVYLVEPRIQTSWDDIISIEDVSSGETRLYCLDFRGGLSVCTGWVAGEIMDYRGFPQGQDVDLDGDDDEAISKDRLDRLARALDDVWFAWELAQHVRLSDHIDYFDSSLVQRMARVMISLGTALEALDESGDNQAQRARLVEMVKKASEILRAAISDFREHEDDDDKRAMGVAALAFWMYEVMFPPNGGDDMPRRQKRLYELLRSAKGLLGESDFNGDSLNMLMDSDRPESDFGSEHFSDERKILIVTDKPMTIKSLAQGASLPGVAFLKLTDLLAYNKKVDVEDHRIEFDIGHPKDGMTYLQHPYSPNYYIDAQSYTSRLLGLKYDELIDVLSALGATSITCTVDDMQSREEGAKSNTHLGAEVSVGVLGRASSQGSTAYSKGVSSKLAKRMAASIRRVPKERPHLPEHTVFFQHESRWMQMAKDVLSGQCVHQTVDLSYSSEYSMTISEASDLSLKIESTVPGLCFGGSSSYSVDYATELKGLASTVWHYEVDFVAPRDEAIPEDAGQIPIIAKGETQSDPAKQSKDGNSRAESLILGKARLYLQADGVDLTDEHHRKLVDMGAKFGVDELRVEELIMEAST